MIELVFSACLAASPLQCKDVHLTFGETNISPMACMMMGQIEMAKWVNTHPAYRVGRFKCAAVRTAEAEI